MILSIVYLNRADNIDSPCTDARAVPKHAAMTRVDETMMFDEMILADEDGRQEEKRSLLIKWSLYVMREKECVVIDSLV